MEFLNLGFVIKDSISELLYLGVLDQEAYEIESVVMFPEEANDAVFSTLRANEISIVEVMDIEDYSQPLNPDIPEDPETPEYFDSADRVSIKEIGTISHEGEGEEDFDLAGILEEEPDEFYSIMLDAMYEILGE